MKKLLLLFAMVVGLLVSNAQAATYTANSTDIVNPTQKPTVWTSNNITWNMAYTWATSTTYTGTDSNGKGFQIGSSKAQCNEFKVSTDAISGTISSVKVNSSIAKSGGATLSVKVGNTEFTYGNNTSVKLETTAKDYEFKGSGSGKIEIIINGTAQKAFYIKTITVTYEEGNQPEQPVEIDDIVATYGTETITSGAEVTVEEGTVFTFKAENATKIEVVGENVSANAAELTWTPAVCTDKLVTVRATRVGSDPKELSFTLTVTAKDPGPGPIEPGENAITETITNDSFNYIDTSYAQKTFTNNTTGISYSSVFSVNTTNNVRYMQFNLGNKNGGACSELVVTDNPNGYILKKVSVKFKDTTGSDYGVNVYAQNAAYTPADFASKTASERTGNLLGTIGTGDNMVSEINVSGNYTSVAIFPTDGSKTIGMASITLVWEKPVSEPAGEIALEHVRHFQLSEYDLTDEVIHVMAGTELTFTSENADNMALSTADEAASTLLPKAANGNTITWTTPDDALDMFELTVTASCNNGTEPRVKTYVVETEFITPAAPKWNEENGQITIACESGALHIKMETAENPAEEVPAMMRAAVQDWTPATTDYHPRKVTYSKAELDNLKVRAKSVTPQGVSKEMDPFMVLGDNVLGIENVAGDFADGEKRYYNLQGMRVAGDCPGIYIVREGSKVSKVVVR